MVFKLTLYNFNLIFFFAKKSWPYIRQIACRLARHLTPVNRA
ncbi:unnamed protein product [Chondrus crispus]|uniref:Uncharacterized protein n=1 Tax=Chondrus crispus TaxID=2769 RepID=R7QCP4_CHOCR|nr:unnamed protein product [Chondrus crispus]CDF35230.1 unnamed protein product [Chondrus crispus]|eukprot:XP_005715049.1 unnamed protein product [Chondrus crispus]